jgi:glycogen operon protein
VVECHVDGFRFDLASALARELYDVDRLSAFFDIIHQDPILSQVKLIAEPWDVGPGGYQVGNFPILWSEWNGIYRDTVRDFWRGEGGVADFAQRFSGSSDLYASDGRRPFASINFVTAHDGFTLTDLVSYNDKHNEANGEENRDGNSNNVSWNCGVEGPTDDPEIHALRERQKRNFLATLLLSQGVPMLLAGDERGHTQQGNNNVYCQDNELAWLDWSPRPEANALRDFVAQLIRVRRQHPSFRRRSFFRGQPAAAGEAKDVVWLRPDGHEMTSPDWESEHVRCLGMLFSGTGITDLGSRGEAQQDDDFLLLLNAFHEPLPFAMPPRPGDRWTRLIDTARDSSSSMLLSEPVYPLQGRSLALLRRSLAAYS